MGLPTEENLYPYDATLSAAILFTVLYSIWTAWQGYLSLYCPCHVTHKHWYTIPLFVAAALSTLGYGVRIASIDNPSSVPLYAQGLSYIVVAPIFICATLYLLLTHLMRLSLPPANQNLYSASPRWLGRVFITSDVFSFLTQCAGSGIASSANWQGATLDVGMNVLLTGLALQLATFTVFLLFLWRFVTTVRNSDSTGFNPCTKKVLQGVWIASVSIQIRTIFRLIEFAMGIEGYLFQNEWCLYVFESVPVWIALGVLAWCHPVKWLQQKPRFEFADKAEGVVRGGVAV